MKNYDLEYELKRHPYGTEGKVHEEKHGDTKFILRSALRYVIDDIDEYLGSVELSHYENLGYEEVGTFDQEEPSTTLDLTWMKKEDTFDLDDSKEYEHIKVIRTNIDNIRGSFLPIREKYYKHVLVVICNANTKLSFVKQVKALLVFLSWNKEYLTGIKLEGFSKLAETILTAYAARYRVPVVEEEPDYSHKKML